MQLGRRIPDGRAARDPLRSASSGRLIEGGVGAVGVVQANHLRGGIGYGDFKKRLLEAVTNHFAPMRERRAEIVAQTGYVERVLAEGAEKARAVARQTLARVRSAVGLGD